MGRNGRQGAVHTQDCSALKTHDVAHANLACARSLLARLVELGICDVVVSSGARCAPLVLAVSDYTSLRVWMHSDERSAAFFAMGATKISRRPTVLICTSGTAGANYYPAVIESFLTHMPLIILTADRPAELHGCGAPQTINQEELYGRYAKLSATLPTPDAAQPEIASQWSAEAERAFRTATDWPAGPVQLNTPFREPLVPDPEFVEQFDPPPPSIPSVPFSAGHDERYDYIAHPTPDVDHVNQLGDLIGAAERCLFIAGPINETVLESVARLSAAAGIPLIADVASQLRCSESHDARIVAHADLLVRHAEFAAAAQPDLVVRFGGLPTSKALNQWLDAQLPREHVIVADGRPIADPYKHSTRQISGRPHDVAQLLVDRLAGRGSSNDAYTAVWTGANRRVDVALRNDFTSRDDMFEGAVVADVFDAVESNSIVMLGNSLPIRMAESYASQRDINLQVIFNRGANGIDGVVSTAMGAAAASRRRVVLIIGDVSFLHDIAGLYLLLQRDLNVSIVLLNNNGGGIFSFLPLARYDAMFEALIAMPHGRTFHSLAHFLGIPHAAPTNTEGFRKAFHDSLGHVGSTLIEVQTNRHDTYKTSESIVAMINELDLINL
ncbi:MAG: 2-succinyl-5-enolpyruvyl-6-hydroxy-3-cyclohexene-1-carboxylic-acid synthase [candidate division Zixibacteria bacterium]|nr:2-succinyl-5-enolpyruvyl-6-hydroxy-3-cyclohexene-1-carboxylic-acid synthase [candidate division Zixibacteria bacterium]